ncbi:hypothetical protein Pint_29962 [Pistacia integerrima]|uniref:Uncharacterized protein n=1 Tax=Pistacia integerrima TaxID=434235 RepID=A0ACC0X007_9ROSI|nr:hypothetical protein Pint_29962 [Pistacia integerrima]
MAISNTKRILVIQFFVIITLLFLKIPAASALSFNFSSFSSNRENMTYQRAYPQNQVILLASGNGMFGRATYYKPLRLWDNATENLTDFTTHFSFIIDSENRSAYGDGLTFFLAPQVSMIPVNATRGGSFGLANDDERLNSTSNPFFAVEFDIYHNHYDPPSIREHVGIDINSLKSVKTVAWWSDVMGGRRNEAWINYNSSTKNLSVEFTGFRNGTIVKQHLDYKVDLRLYLPEFVTFGFSGATGNATATHTVNSWEFSSSLEDGNSTNPPVSPNLVDGRKSKTGLAVGLGIVGGVLVAGLVLVRLACFGLLYLHEEWEQCVLHRDIKSSNIMLDSNFNSKLGDFGLATFVDHAKGSHATGLAGTRGYMAPECLKTKKTSKESDVFSFGVVALEIACGRRSIEHKYEEDQVSLVPWVWESYRNERLLDIADKKLCMNFDVKQMECLLIVGLLCAHPDRNQRPSIRQVIQFLNFELALPNLPPNMPASNYDHMLCTAAAVGSSHAPSQSLTILR